ncbi:hypothetical protein SOCEGT47_034290 [Sorangium cellulosum]|uniref:Uncharacterized protein n=1 Tax=Sorangium cellulosum TaxID=56 RepID=A0A4P2Q258_SORCE|nr:hypothetical protein [Sorangium cellulosum]AUX22913.1 hypothetical protein SOCEGT47_034290 [Sorangium cellulosum]
MQNITTQQGEIRKEDEQATTDVTLEQQQRAASSRTLLESFLPDADIVINDEIVVMATPEVTYSALKSVDFTQSRSLLLRAVLALRVAETRRARRKLGFAPLPARARVSLENVEDYGHIRLAEKEGVEIAIGEIMRPMSAASLFEGRTAAEFKAFDCPGYIKAVGGFVVMPYGEKRTLLLYEARIRATDTPTRRQLVLWNTLTMPLVALLTTQKLAHVKRAAERQCAAPGYRQAISAQAV